MTTMRQTFFASIMIMTAGLLTGCGPQPPLMVDAVVPADQTKNIFLSQLEATGAGPTLRVYSIQPETLQAQMVYTILQPTTDGYFADGPMNASAANDTVQWADGGAYAIVRFNRTPGMGTTLPPYYQSWYRFDPVTQTTTLIYTTDHEVLPGWILGDGAIYFLQSSKVVGDNTQDKAEVTLTAVRVADSSVTNIALQTDLKPYEQDALTWNTDQTALLWVGKEAEVSYLYTYTLGTQLLEKQTITLAANASDALTSNVSHQGDRYASTGFFADTVQLYNFTTQTSTEIAVGAATNNTHLYFSNDDKKLFVSTEAGIKVVDLETAQVELLRETGGLYRPTRFGTVIIDADQLYLYRKGELQAITGVPGTERTIVGLSDFQ